MDEGRRVLAKQELNEWPEVPPPPRAPAPIGLTLYAHCVISLVTLCSRPSPLQDLSCPSFYPTRSPPEFLLSGLSCTHHLRPHPVLLLCLYLP